MSWYGGYGEWPAYVPVAQRRVNALRHAAELAVKENRALAPVKIEGRKIARSFWGLAWCENLERYSDYANRLPRGGTYVRNGSVVDLQISKGNIQAIVAGSEVYTVTIKIETLPKTKWSKIKEDCSQSIDSLLELVQGKFERGIMERLTHREHGLFPQPREIKLRCSCPDSATMCKHVAAVMYGIGHRLDSSPELLFLLRDVDHLELIGHAVTAENLDRSFQVTQDNDLSGSDLGELFGIELDIGQSATNVTRIETKTIVTKTKVLARKSTKKVAKTQKSSRQQTVDPPTIQRPVDSAPKKKKKAAATQNKSGSSRATVVAKVPRAKQVGRTLKAKVSVSAPKKTVRSAK